MIVLKKPVEFEWDENNQDKNFEKNNVSTHEVEEVFLNDDRKILKDFLHSTKEDRFLILGQTRQKRKLFVVFTLREHKVRVISARDLNKKEHKLLGKDK